MPIKESIGFQTSSRNLLQVTDPLIVEPVFQKFNSKIPSFMIKCFDNASRMKTKGGSEEFNSHSQLSYKTKFKMKYTREELCNPGIE